MANGALAASGETLPPAIGRFRIERVLGQGAQGIVYLGHDPKLEREVAIKSLRLDAGARDPQLVATLHQEARTVGRVQHANIVSIFDAGDHDGVLYLVFEYVPGETLSSLARQPPGLDAARATAVMRDVITGMAYAHQRKIIHRDLKPANILIDADGVAKITDFGIARIVSGERSKDDALIGTPRYMAPEYISDGVQTPGSDVFALGLMFHELLTGQPAIRSRKLPDIFRHITSGRIDPPSSANAQVDEQLDTIVMRALERDPKARYPDAQAMREALDEYGSAKKLAGIGASDAGQKTTVSFLLRRMRHKSDFPALSGAIRGLNQLVVNDRQSAAKLSSTILKDFALTNKILRTVNSAFYRRSAGQISTISRAVVILGLPTVRNIASSMMLFEHLQDKNTQSRLNEDILAAMFSGVLASELAQSGKMRHGEEAFLCATFHNLGRLLTTYYLPEESAEIERMHRQQNIGRQQAASAVLGVSFEDLGIAIAREWDFPENLIKAMRGVGAKALPAGRNPEDRLRYLACYANEVSEIVGEADTTEIRGRRLRDVSQRFRDAVGVNPDTVNKTLERAGEKFSAFTALAGGDTRRARFKAQLGEMTRQHDQPADDPTVVVDSADSNVTACGLLDTDGDGGSVSILEQDVTCTPESAQQVLTAGIQDISDSLVGDYSLNDIFRIVLETVYRGLGFTRVMLLLKNPRKPYMQARLGLGPDMDRLITEFGFSTRFAPDVFHAALKNDVDVLIHDVSEKKIRGRIPDWYTAMFPARSFVLFPVVMKGKPLALFYADNDRARAVTIEDRELRLLKTLRNQATLAIKQKML